MKNVMFLCMFFSYTYVFGCMWSSVLIVIDQLIWRPNWWDNNLNPGAPSTNDSNNILCSFVDDSNDEDGAYSDFLYVPTENGENMLS